MKKSLWVLGVAFLLASTLGAASPQYDKYGGWSRLKGNETGFFHTQQINGRWWLVTPEGNVFISKGVCHISFEEGGPQVPHTPPPGNWAETVGQQLREWGFNTVGSWSDQDMYTTGLAYTVMLGAAGTARHLATATDGVPDYFSAEFRTSTDRLAQKLCEPKANDPWLLGYFTDNEQAWTSNNLSWGDEPWNLKQSLLETYLKMPPNSAGYQKANEFMKARGMIKGAVTEDDRAGFQELATAEYGRICRDAIHRYDPNHIILGCRYAGHAPDPVVRGMGPYFDVISFNNYDSRPPVWKLQHLTEISGKPIMISEFSFKAMDSGLPNTKGAGQPVATQQDRADGFTQYVQDLLAMPSCVGFHWFEYRDEPAAGRGGDGENSNYGLVKIDGAPWEVLTSRMREVNASLESFAVQKQKSQ